MWFGLLGPLVVRIADQEQRLPAAKQRVLLAALLLMPGQVVSAARLTELLWNGEPPKGAEVTLRSHVKRLRQALGPAGGARIVSRPGGYLIEARTDELDVAQYEALCAAGESAACAGDWQRAADTLTEAQRLWRGPPFADVPSQVLQVAEVPRLEELRLQAIQCRIEADLQLGRAMRVLSELQTLVAEQPLREPFHGQLMLALYRCGRTADALAVFRRARGALVAEIGVEPGPELQLLHRRILAGDTGLRAASANQAAEPAAVHPARAAPVPRHLPPALPGFVGRSAELGQLTDMLDAWAATDGTTVIGVISGPAGVGKTTLAVYWANQAASDCPDGQLYLDLNGFAPAGAPLTQDEAVSRVLEALQVAPARVPASLHGRIGLYRSLLSERRLLLVLDNARDAEQVRPLLPTGAGSLVLVTSRVPLTGLMALNGAKLQMLDVFSEQEAQQMVMARLGERITQADRAATARLISACGRLPLALAVASALAAVRQSRSLTDVANDLARASTRLDALDAGEQNVNVRSALHSSYRTLEAAPARMFRLLAEHPGPDIASPAAASLAGLPPAAAVRALANLTGLHLLTEHQPGRYRLHDLVRLYAAEMLAADEPQEGRRAAGCRMLDHYLHAAWAAALAINPSREAPRLRAAGPAITAEVMTDARQASAWLTAEHQGLMRLIAYAADTGSDAHAVQLPWALSDFLDRGGHWPDFAASQQIAVAAAIRAGDKVAEARAHRYLGRAVFALQDMDSAHEHFSRTLQLRHELADPAGEAGALIDLCRVHETRGDGPEAIRCAKRALDLYRAQGDLVGEAFALNAVAWHQALDENFAEALVHGKQAVELSLKIDRPMIRALAMDSVGYVYHHTGRPTLAIAWYQQAIEILVSLGDRYATARALNYMGDAHNAAGDPAAAEQTWREALAILDDLEHPEGDRLRQKLAACGLSGSE